MTGTRGPTIRRRAGAVLLALGALLSLLVLLPATALAAPGELDTTFGTGGTVSSPTGASESLGLAADVAVQADGKIVAVSGHVSGDESEFLVERFNADGSPDSSFGSGGIVLTSFPGSSEAVASSVIVEPSGKILVAGTAGGEFALARYNSDGTLDTSFGGGDGKSTAADSIPNASASGFWSESGSMALTPSGEIVLGGNILLQEYNAFTEEPYWESHMVVARFAADGSIDTSFGTDGLVVGPAGNLYGLTVDANGRALAAGWSNTEFAVARFTTSGSLDSSFAGTGLVKMNLSATGSKAAGVLVLPGGKILAAGYGQGMTIFRFNENGSLDTTFGGGDGTVTPSFSSPCCAVTGAAALALEADGRIVIAGNRIIENYEEENPFTSEWAVARLHANGVPDKTFGTSGLTTEGFEGTKNYGEYASGVALQSDGKIVAVGTSGYPDSDLGLMRFLGGGSDVEPSYHRLAITNAEPSDGRVRGLDLFCGYNCAADYEAGETVELHAEGAYVEEGSEWTKLPFTGWTTVSGDPGTCTGTTTPCEVTLAGDVELLAQFGEGGPASVSLEVSKAGTGSGTVTSSPSGINCGSTCQAEFAGGTPVTLTAAPQPGSTFTGWSGGGCSGTGACEVTLNSGTHVTATFASAGGGEEEGSGKGGGGSGGSPAPTGQSQAGVSSPGSSSHNSPGGVALAGGVAVSKGGSVSLNLSCSSGASCNGVLKLVAQAKGERASKRHDKRRLTKRAKSIVIGKARFAVAAGHSATVTVKLNGKGKTLLRQAGKHGLSVRLTGSGIRSRTVRLKTNRKTRRHR
jgi:uncharacterized delta-60 repeat protein